MAAGWVKVFQCKTNAIEDVYDQQKQQPTAPKKPTKPPYKKKNNINNLYSNLGCGDTSHNLKCIVRQTKLKTRKPKSSKSKSSCSKSHRLPSKPQPSQQKEEKRKIQMKLSSISSLATLVPLPPDHSSRKVVEIIFSSSWFNLPTNRTTTGTTTFPGDIEMVFKVANPSKKFTVFEEYREKVRSCAGPEDSRCAVDGNEMMRFHSAPTSLAEDLFSQPICWNALTWSLRGDGEIRTFAGSGGAHAGVAGRDGRGTRRAMVVCRVIAGRVWTGLKVDLNPVQYESITVRKGELVVFDPRAVLPCFVVIYSI